jgi:hypothetical protein
MRGLGNYIPEQINGKQETPTVLLPKILLAVGNVGVDLHPRATAEHSVVYAQQQHHGMPPYNPVFCKQQTKITAS